MQKNCGLLRVARRIKVHSYRYRGRAGWWVQPTDQNPTVAHCFRSGNGVKQAQSPQLRLVALGWRLPTSFFCTGRGAMCAEDAQVTLG